MENKETILRVKDLRISFRTVSGKVQAVRGVFFNLKRGETLAIVGESGSGKSVTNKAIMGILAQNSIIESGEILYDGKDLLRISEEDFHKIRGNKISMIFQDPLSSLNPIVRIGRQLTEATLLKNKSSRRKSAQEFNAFVNALEKNILSVCPNDEAKAKAREDIRKFRTWQKQVQKIGEPYTNAGNALLDALSELEDLIPSLEAKADFDVLEMLEEIHRQLTLSKHPYVLKDEDWEKALALSHQMIQAVHPLLKEKKKDFTLILDDARALEAIASAASELTKPSLLGIGYHLALVSETLPEGSMEEINQKTEGELNQFLESFLEEVALGVKRAREVSLSAMKESLPMLEESIGYFQSATLDPKEAKEKAQALSIVVSKTINPLSIIKDSYSLTFKEALNSCLDKYFSALKTNPKEEARYAKEQAKYDALAASGKTPSWKPLPANILPDDLLRKNICVSVENVILSYQAVLSDTSFDEKNEAKAVIRYLEDKAHDAVYKVTKAMAKNTAIKLMKEVGIAEPRRRFKQYPFEFSGGMRQRIVIAIALTANPEILICDEPTTALDVTIQAQILELINRIKKERNLSVIFITHNLGVVANMADKIAVMYAGKIVEYGTSDDIFYNPKHPYTWALLSSMPDLETKEKLDAIPGTPPNMIYPPKGDAFAPRNKYALDIDFREEPPFFRLSPTHYAATWLCDLRAPKVEMPSIVTERINRMKAKYGAEIKAEEAKDLASDPDEAYAQNSVTPEEFCQQMK